jgi:hypothetical protein
MPQGTDATSRERKCHCKFWMRVFEGRVFEANPHSNLHWYGEDDASGFLEIAKASMFMIAGMRASKMPKQKTVRDVEKKYGGACLNDGRAGFHVRSQFKDASPKILVHSIGTAKDKA